MRTSAPPSMHRSIRRIAIASAATATLAIGLAAAPGQAAPPAPQTTTPTHLASTPAHPDFSGIVALSDCSASIVRFPDSRPGDTAMMLTNGHCTKFYRSHEVQVNRPLVRNDVTLLNADGSDAATISTTTLLYGTMFKTDVSLYALDLTYAQLQSQYGVPALTIQPQRTIPNQRVVIVSGYWKRAYACHLNGFVYQLHEYHWYWHDSLRYADDGCHTIGGTSGSPVLVRGTTDVVGINNTGNEDGEQCTFDNPCEIDRNGNVTVHEGRNYGQQTWWFTTCLSQDGRTLDLSSPGCLLPKP